MPADELFDVEVFHPVPQGVVDVPAHLPLVAAPLPGEALIGWLHRFAEPLGVHPALLFFEATDHPFLTHGSWWRRPVPVIVERLARRTGLSIADIRAMTFGHWASDPTSDDVPERFARARFRYMPRAMYPVHRHAVCPRCLAEDRVPYLRKTWTLGWVTVCETHRLVLVSECPDCWGKFRMPSVVAKGTFRPTQCHCGQLRTGLALRPAHGLAWQLHLALLWGREHAQVALPVLGIVPWTVAIALFDALLDMVWLKAVPRSKHPLLARMKDDLGLTDGVGKSSYDGLLILAWLLENWPRRFVEAVETLQVPCPRRASKRWQYLDPDVRRGVEAVLTPVCLSAPSGGSVSHP
jgi:hypothetical protein